MPYTITAHTRAQAAALGVAVRPSTTRGKKIDVVKNGKKVASVGAAGYGDYPTYLRTHGQEYAKERRRLYRLRHAADLAVRGSPGFFAGRLLW